MTIMWTPKFYAVALVILAGLGSSAAPASAAPDGVSCIAHRGGIVAGHSEETIPTYTSALTTMPDVEIEGDIRFSRTGYPMMLHNGHLGEFGAPTVLLADLSVGQAKAFVAPTGDTMASLYDLRILLLAHPGARAQLELKEAMTPERWTMLASRIDVLRPRVTLTSFNINTVREAQDRGYRTGFLSSADHPTTAAPLFIQAWAQIDAASVQAHTDVGVQTQAYTPDTVAAWNTVLSAGVTAIITNQPAACLAWSGPPSRR
jgi:glycerophosphoryl diester phosphodiesterase